MEKLLKKMRLERLKKGYSQDYMAFKLDISQKSYSKLENNKTKMRLDRLLEISKILELDINDLLSN